MAIIDKYLLLADGQAIATTTSETVSTNVIDLYSANFDPGQGRPAYLHIQVEEAVTHASALTVTFKVLTDSDATVVGGTTVYSIAKAKADLAAGDEIVVTLPVDGLLQYLGVSHTCSATTATGGKFNMWIDLG